MNRRTLIASLGLAGLAWSRARAASALPVVASFSILADMVRCVGGEAVAVTAFVGPDQDVHTYDPRPKDLRTLMAASLLVQNGLGLEGWMVRLTGSAGFKGRIVTATEKVVPRTMAETRGVIATDPHAWQDPRNAVLYVQAILEGLVAADGANAALYRANAEEYSARIAETTAVQQGSAALPLRNS